MITPGLSDDYFKKLLRDSYTEIKSLRKQVNKPEKNKNSPIAIVGIGCRFPDGCDSPESFWQYLQNGKCSIKEMTNERWDSSAFDAKEGDLPGKISSRYMSLVDGVDQFDSALFNLPAAEIQAMDPQQRMLLLVCYEAIQNAGIDVEGFRGSKTGVFVGCSTNDYSRLTMNNQVHDNIDGYACLGSAASVGAGRISYLMDFNGPAITLDTSCSSSLLSVHLACESIRNGESDVALSGGVNLILTPENSIALSKMQALSTSGLCKTFDADADGYVRGEGCGIVVLKSLAQAEADGDDIYAVIQGSATNHDGASNGLTAPNGIMQEQLIAQALNNAGVQAQDIHYVETHGTGTPLGDPIEINALASVLRGENPEKPLVIGSVKTNIGHLESAAGIAALIKLVMCTKNNHIPAHLHFNEPNPHIPWDKYNLKVPTDPEMWNKDGNTGYGAVSAFGLSGTNVHLITSPPNPSIMVKNEKDDDSDSTPCMPSLLTISARSSDALALTANRWVEFLKTTDAELDVICDNSQNYRNEYDYRMVVTGTTHDDLLAGLQKLNEGAFPKNIYQGKVSDKISSGIAMLFTGQGSQYIDMGRSLYEHDSVFRTSLDECDRLFKLQTGHSILSILWGNSEHDINNTQYTQPAIFSIQIGLIEFWRSKGVEASYVIGHSIGEYAAAFAADVMSLKDAMHLVVMRGQLMVEMCEHGDMLAIRADAKVAKALLDDHDSRHRGSVAAINSAKNVVIAAPSDVIEDIMKTLSSEPKYAEVKHTLLSVSHAFHSPSMQPMLQKFKAEVESITLQAPKLPFYSTVTGSLVSLELCDPEYWSNQISSTVKFDEALLSLAENNVAAYLEMGSDTILISLASATLNLDSEKALYSLSRRELNVSSITQAVSKLCILGMLNASKKIDEGITRRLAIPAAAPVLASYWCEYKPNYVGSNKVAPVHKANLQAVWEPIDLSSHGVMDEEKCLVISSQNDEHFKDIFIDKKNTTYISFSENDNLDDFDRYSKGNYTKVVIVDPQFNMTNIVRQSFILLELVKKIITNSIVDKNGTVCFFSFLNFADQPEVTLTSSIDSLCNVLRHEYETLTFQRLEIADAITKSNLEKVESLVYQSSVENSYQRILLKDNTLFQSKLKEAFSLDACESELKKTWINAQGNYLITGGVGALGLLVAEMLASQGAGQLLLVTRRKVLDEETSQRIADMRSKGCVINLIQADITDLDNIKAKLNDYINVDKPLNGIVHCAGVLKDQLVSQVNFESFEKVLQPKIEGALNLHMLSLDYSLDFFVMFGSIASIVGNAGQSAYAMANGFLSSLSHYRRELKLPAQTISWGPWGGNGMAEDKNISLGLAEMGISLLSLNDGMQRFNQCMNNPELDPIILDLITSKIIKNIPQLNYPQEFNHYVNDNIFELGGDDSDSIPEEKSQSSIFSDYIDQHKPAAPLSSAIAFLRREVDACFGHSDTPNYSASQPLNDLDFDSLMAVNLRSTLSKLTGKSLPVSLLFDYPSLNELAKYLLKICSITSESEAENSTSEKNINDIEEIAIIGMGCRLPGGIESPEQFWTVLNDGVDCVTDIGKSRWDSNLYFDENPDAPGKMYSRWGGLIDNVDQFDNTFFGVSKQEAIMMDPQQRLLMEVGWQALEDANIVASEHSDAGVFVGCGQNEYSQILRMQGLSNTNTYFGTGSSISVTAGRLAYHLGWQGPAIAIDTACSSSLVSINLACDAIRKGDCNIALAGGVNLTLSPQTNIGLSKARMLSPVGRCKTFDNSADGYVRSEGCALVVLKPLKEAILDGDNVLAVIKSGGINHDGRSQGLTAPNGPSQERLMEKVLNQANLSPNDIQYVEAHGTGTPLGDPIEMNSIEQVYLKDRKDKLYVGSVKTNIGHTEAAAGVSSLMKVVLMLQHEKIVKNIHLEKLNEHFSDAIRSEDGLIEIPKNSLPWPNKEKNTKDVKYAAISSFGFSGTNAHLIITQSPENSTQPVSTTEDPFWVLPVSGRSQAALRENSKLYSEYLARHSANDQMLALKSLCYVASCKREHFEHRTAVCAENADDIIVNLLALSDSNVEVKNTSAPLNNTHKGLAFMFTGQGSQYLDMGKTLAETASVFKETIVQCDLLMQEELGESILDVIWGDDPKKINNTFYTQPGLFVFEYALAKQWQAWGVEPEFILGHSIGEYAAACLAGVFSLDDAIKLVCARSRLMVEHCDTGAMLVLFCNAEEAKRIVDILMQRTSDTDCALSIAAENTPSNTVVAGSHDAVAKLAELCKSEDIYCQSLNVSHGFHSVLMQPMLAVFKSVVESVTFHAPSIRFISTLTGQEVSNECCEPEYWVKHIHQSVKFNDAVQCLNDKGSNAVLEIGPGNQLIGMAKSCLPDQDMHYMHSMKKHSHDWKNITNVIAQLYKGHVNIDWQKIYAASTSSIVSMPTYAFQRQVIWPALPEKILFPSEDAFALGGGVSNGLSSVVESPLGRNTVLANGAEVFENQAAYDFPFNIEDHRLYGTVVLPGASHLAMTAHIGDTKNWKKGHEIRNVLFPEAMIFSENDIRDVQYVINASQNDVRDITAFSRLNGHESRWITHYSATIHDLPDNEQDRYILEFDPTLWQSELKEKISGDMFYQEMSAAGYQLKDSFCWIENLWRKPGISLTRLRAPSGATEGSYPFYPGLMDAFFQSTAAANEDDQFNLREKEDIYIPMAVDAMGIIAKATGPLWCYAELVNLGTSETYTHRIWVFDDSGKCLLWVDALRSKKAPKDVLLKSMRQMSRNLTYDIHWEDSPLKPETIDATIKDDVYLVVGYQPHIALLKFFKQKNQLCYVLDLQDLGISIDDSDESIVKNRQLIDEKLNELLNDNLVTRVISLCGVDYEPVMKAMAMEDTINLSQNAIVQPNIFVQQYLTNMGAEPHWMILALNSNTDFPPFSSSLIGFSRVLRNESNNCQIKYVEIDNADFSKQAISQEITAEDNEIEIYYDFGGNRQVSRFYPKLLDNDVEIDSDFFDGNKSYLIAGGLGGIGLSLTDFMIRHGARNIFITTRREPDANIESLLAKFNDGSSRVTAIKCDISQQLDVEKMFSTIESIAPIDGIFNCAGVLNDGLISGQSWQDFKIPFDSKIQGSWWLHHASKNINLNWFVLFSSAASVFGAAGQANYATANSFMDGLAVYRQQNQLPALSLNWGPWAGEGMASSTEVVNNLGRNKGLGMLDSEEAFMTMVTLAQQSNETGQGKGNHTVIDIEWEEFSGTLSDQLTDTLFSSVVVSNNSRDSSNSIGMALDITKFKKDISLVDADKRFDFALNTMTKVTNELMALDEDYYIDPDEALQNIGFDSLMALELRNVISKTLDEPLPATLLFDMPTLSLIVNFIVNKLFEDELTDNELNVNATDESFLSEKDNDNLDVDGLSDEDLTRLLEEELL